MTETSARTLFWTPCLLGIAFALFVSLFALDVFAEGLGFWRTLAALFMHLVPALAIAAALAIAWRYEWAGVLLFPAIGVFFVIIARGPMAKIVFGGIPFAMAVMFLVHWWASFHKRAAP